LVIEEIVEDLFEGFCFGGGHPGRLKLFSQGHGFCNFEQNLVSINRPFEISQCVIYARSLRPIYVG
jgi:hypothetical protein